MQIECRLRRPYRYVRRGGSNPSLGTWFESRALYLLNTKQMERYEDTIDIKIKAAYRYAFYKSLINKAVKVISDNSTKIEIEDQKDPIEAYLYYSKQSYIDTIQRYYNLKNYLELRLKTNLNILTDD